MPRIFIAVSIAIAFLFLPAAAQEMTLEQLLEAHYEAQGGLDKLRAVRTTTFKGTLTMGPVATLGVDGNLECGPDAAGAIDQTAIITVSGNDSCPETP